jgi:methylmalonyl-CoA mutase
MTMPEKSIHSSLRETFPRVNKKMWQGAAAQEVKGEDPFAQLAWKSKDNIVFLPYYDHHDTAPLEYLKKFQHAASENSYSGPKKWLCVPRISVQDEITANKTSLEHLSNGADGVLFHILSDTSASKLLHGIEWPFCSLFFHAHSSFLIENLPLYITQNNIDPQLLTGALFWDSSPKRSDVDFYLRTTQNLYSLGLVIQPSSSVQEIAEALTEGVRLVEKISDVTNDETLFRSISFSVPAGTLFFESVAKLKALRLLWYQVSQAYGIKSYKPSDLHIHVRSIAWIKENFEPHGNMIKSATAAMAAVMGGCDSLTVDPQDEHNSTMNRIARNVSAVLREESHLDKVADPLAGSYATDIMVHEIAHRAWTLFQSNMR